MVEKNSEIRQTALPLDPPQISDLQELVVKWIDGQRTFVFFHLFHKKKKKRKPEQRGHCCCCADLTQKMKVSTGLFSSNGIISSVCALKCVCVCVYQHDMKLCYTVFHCSFECWRCTLLWCDVCVKWGHLNSLSFMTQLKLLKHSFARFCSIFRNDESWCFRSSLCACVSV